MNLIAITGLLNIVDGAPQEGVAIPGVLAQAAPPRVTRGRERDYLFVHLTLSGAQVATDGPAQELALGLSRRYYEATGSVTSALRRAVIELNEKLLYQNVSGGRPAMEGAITCAAMHGDELFTLQVGEALAFLGHNFGVERLPSRPPAQITPLGRSAGIDIRFAYHRLQPGDMLLLADPRLAYLDGQLLRPVVVDTDIETGLNALVNVIGDNSGRLLLAEFADRLPATAPLYMDLSRQRSTAAMGRVAADPAPSASGVETDAAPMPRRGPVREADLPPLQAAPEPGSDGAPGMERRARRAASQSARGLSGVSAWLAALMTPNRADDDVEPEETSLGWLLLAGMAIVIPVLVAVIVTSVYLQRGNVQQLAEIKQGMVNELVLAEEAGADATAARAHYNAVMALASEAEALRPRDGEVARMRADAREQLDVLDGITRLSSDLYRQYNGSSDMSEVTLRGVSEGGIFLLDRANNRVLLQNTDETYTEPAEGDPVTVVFDGQVVGTQVVGPLVDLLWRPAVTAETRDGVEMLDRTGVLFTYYPNLGDLRAVTLGYSSAWQEPRAIATYGGRLYVLDAGAGEIWKYYPQGEGYVQNPDDIAIAFSDDPDLGQAVDFDLYSEDGSLVVVYQDGRIRYYDTRSGRAMWDETTLAQNGLAAPMVSPAAVKLVGRGLNASIFVLDPGSSRIIQISRGGTVLAQYRSEDETGGELFGRAADFDVAESPLRIFVTSGPEMHLATRN